jgi:steroid delta-isomerase-like uncharacterized protein
MSLQPTSTRRTLLALAALAACACANTSNRSAAVPDPIRDENKRNVAKLFESCFNRGDMGVLDELVSPEYIGEKGDKGPAGFKQVIAGLRSAFPDIRYTVEDVIAENDKVAVRWHWSGTHQAPFRGFPPTRKAFSNTGTGIFRLQGGKIVAASLETDRLGFLQQVGAVPEDVLTPRITR